MSRRDPTRSVSRGGRSGCDISPDVYCVITTGMAHVNQQVAMAAKSLCRNPALFYRRSFGGLIES